MPFGNPPFDPSDFGCGPVGDCVARQGGFDLSARIAPCNKTYACFLRNTIHLLALLAALTLSAREQTDTLKVLSGIRGADVTVYNLYQENRATDRAKAMEYAELFLSSADTTAAEPLLAAVCDELADWYEYDRSLFSRAIRWRSRSLSIYESLGDRHNEALAQYRLSREYTSLGQYHRALQYVSSAMNYFERTHDTDNLIECYNILGVVYFTCRQYDRAYEWFTRYTDGARMAGDTSRMVLGLNNSAVLAYTLRDTLKARTLIRESGFLSSAVRDTSKLCKVYLNNVSLYLMSGDLQAAASTLETVKPLLRKPDETGLYYQDEGLLLMAAGRLDEAAAALGKAISAFGTGEYGSKIQHCYGILQRIYAMKGEYRNAYQALIQYYEADIANRLDEIFLDFYKVQKELEMSREQEKMSRRQNLVIFLCSIGVLSLVFILILLYGKSKRKSLEIRRQEEEIASQNELIELRKLHDYQIGRMTEELSHKLTELNAGVKDQTTRKKISAICRELVKSKDENEWREMNRFVPAFNSVFYQRLIADFPTLSINERRLCALLNMNMTTKEISEITRQSPHSINIARARLRSKFNLTGKTTSLQEFLSRYNP